MKNTFFVIIALALLQACVEPNEISSINRVNWEKRALKYELGDTLTSGTSYLSIYSQIYFQSERRTYDLTATVSMRNTSRKDSIFVDRAEYYDTKGNLIRSYFDHTIIIAPMETVEIVIDELDTQGGTGANFIFDWKTRPGINEPLFEGVMISTAGQQGLSFTTHGQRVH